MKISTSLPDSLWIVSTMIHKEETGGITILSALVQTALREYIAKRDWQNNEKVQGLASGNR